MIPKTDSTRVLKLTNSRLTHPIFAYDSLVYSDLYFEKR